MRVRYVTRDEAPGLYEMTQDLARKANIKMPRLAVTDTPVPNAFAFGRGISDGRICVTRGIVNLLNEAELKAVLGHELSHIKNHDVLFITLLSVVPMVLYRIFIQIMYFGGDRRRDNGSAMLIALGALVLYFVTNLLVLYASRIREYFADKGSVELGNSPHTMATALYKLVYGAARVSKEELQAVEGAKAFFVNDVSNARNEIQALSELDLDKSGTIDKYELARLKHSNIKVNTGSRLMEVFSTHPDMLKRIKQLSEYAA
jgi:heat shock protein HtpX